MVTISLAIPSGKPAVLPPLTALESLPNNIERATAASPLASYVAGLTYPLLTTENLSDGALPPLTFPADGVNVYDWDVLGPDNDSDVFVGDTSMSS